MGFYGFEREIEMKAQGVYAQEYKEFVNEVWDSLRGEASEIVNKYKPRNHKKLLEILEYNFGESTKMPQTPEPDVINFPRTRASRYEKNWAIQEVRNNEIFNNLRLQNTAIMSWQHC